MVAAGGGLDLLDDDAREAADRFVDQYAALRRREGWVGRDGREDPESGEPLLWKDRLESVAKAAAVLSADGGGSRPTTIVDVGSGGGWAARFLGDADVIAVDLIDSAPARGALHVRGDMRRLPLRDATVDAALYAASLHYAPIEDSIREAARVLRPGGLIVAVDSPMYRDRRDQARAEARSAAYYGSAGFPELAAHYHPIDVTYLHTALVAAGFEVLSLDTGLTTRRWWGRPGRARHSSFLAARLNAGRVIGVTLDDDER